MTLDLKPENVVTWLELHALEQGTENQMERWLAKLLPEDELTALARKEIFAGFDPYKRWQNISELDADNAIRHGDLCDDPDLASAILFETKPAYNLTHDQWELMKRVQATTEATRKHAWCVEGGCTVRMQPRVHVAVCARCNGSVRYPAALVTVEWAGRTLTREYAL